MTEAPDIRWNEAGLAPAIVQDADSARVLMLGWMNAEALEHTHRTGLVHFWSRSRQTLWQKGETSGNVLRVQSLTVDCDRDALLVRAVPAGPTCHTGAVSCFNTPDESFGEVLGELVRIVRHRAAERPKGSYTAKLLEGGVVRVGQKVGEEGVEAALAAAAGSEDELVAESADLIYHLLVLLEARGVHADRLAGELRRRFPVSEAPGAPRSD